METKKTIPFTTTSRNKIKCVRINSTKKAKDLYSENCKTPKKIQIHGSLYNARG